MNKIISLLNNYRPVSVVYFPYKMAQHSLNSERVCFVGVLGENSHGLQDLKKMLFSSLHFIFSARESGGEYPAQF